MEGVCSAQVHAQNKHSGDDRDAMKKNIFCLALGAMLFALCFSAEAQEPKVYCVGETHIQGRLLAELCEFSMADLQSKSLSLSGWLILMREVFMIDVEKALLDPGLVFKTPGEVVANNELTRAQKIEILRRWEYDVRELQVADEEGMQGPEPVTDRKSVV